MALDGQIAHADLVTLLDTHQTGVCRQHRLVNTHRAVEHPQAKGPIAPFNGKL